MNGRQGRDKSEGQDGGVDNVSQGAQLPDQVCGPGENSERAAARSDLVHDKDEGINPL